MTFDKYITIKDKEITFGMTAAGAWICKELPVGTDLTKADVLMAEATRLCNKHNKGVAKKKVTPTKVKGLK